MGKVRLWANQGLKDAHGREAFYTGKGRRSGYMGFDQRWKEEGTMKYLEPIS